jgi:hypothetical protein
VHVAPFLPPQRGEDPGNPELHRPGNISCWDVQRLRGDLDDGADIDLPAFDRVAVGIGPKPAVQPLLNGQLPGVFLQAGFLFGSDVLRLRICL